jgi:protein-L-isoaspartate(D-aspartate) O-methyltransferase
VAVMSELLGLEADERVLEIGTGSGYQAAVLGELAAEVYTIEIVPSLGERARDVLRELGYDNVHVRVGDGYQGWPEHAPFDAIIVTAAPQEVPQPLLDQLADGGRLVVPEGEAIQQLVLYVRHDGPDGPSFERRPLMGVRFVPMTGEVRRR